MFAYKERSASRGEDFPSDKLFGNSGRAMHLGLDVDVDTIHAILAN